MAPGGAGLDNDKLFIQELADLSLNSAARCCCSTAARTNMKSTAPAVQGSTNAPAEWLRLTIDPHSPDVFSWLNVVYCNDPASTWQ